MLILITLKSQQIEEFSANDLSKNSLLDSYQEEHNNISISFDTLNTKVRQWAKSNIIIDVELVLTSKKTGSIIKSVVLKPKDSTIIREWDVSINSSELKSFSKLYKLDYYYGNPKLIKPDTTYLYRLPFKKNKKYEVSQSFKGKFSHNSKASNYAIDFSMPIGEPIYASRGGLVIYTKSHFKEYGGKAFTFKANRIIIFHDDGTTASYVHLDYDGVLVKVGQRVEKGDKIGYSGFTGYTRGPHLHFVVRKERDISIPIYFEGYPNKILRKGKRYKIKS